MVRELSDAMENIEELREQPDLEKEIINMVVKSGAVFNHPEVARARNTWVDKPHRDKNPSYEKEGV